MSLQRISQLVRVFEGYLSKSRIVCACGGGRGGWGVAGVESVNKEEHASMSEPSRYEWKQEDQNGYLCWN